MAKSQIALSKEQKEQISVAMDYDVTALPDYVDEQSDSFVTTLVENAAWMSKLQVEENVKGSRTIKLLNADLTLQTMSGCTPNPDGGVTFTGRNITTTRLYVGAEFCNEELNGKYTQLLNRMGASAQDEQLPLEDVLLAHLGMVVKRKIQRVLVLGDTDSVDSEIALFDGAAKLINNEATNVYYTTDTAWSSTNAFTLALGVYNQIPSVVFDDQLEVELLTGRTEARLIIEKIYNDKDYSANLQVTEEGGNLSFILPTTNTRVRTVPELDNTGNMFGFIYEYAFIGTDAQSDMDDLRIVWDEYDRKLKVEGIFRLGFQIIQPQYWTRLRLGATS